MGGNRGADRGYDVYGDDLDSIRSGFDELGMPTGRQTEAFAIVQQVLVANGASVLHWYKPPRTDELACYWDDSPVNMLWVTASEVHVAAGTPRPARALNWEKQDGAYVGWLLPGAEAGSGGGTKKTEVAEVPCPVSFILHPLGTECPHCEIVHG